MSRYVENKKGSTVKLRIDDDTKIFIETSARNKGMTVSEYIRWLIEKERAAERERIKELCE